MGFPTRIAEAESGMKEPGDVFYVCYASIRKSMQDLEVIKFII